MWRGARGWCAAIFMLCAVASGTQALASANLPLHHWVYDAIERLTAMGVIDQAMLGPKPYSRKEAARYVTLALERVRADEAPVDGQEAIAEPLLERLVAFLRPELEQLGAVKGTKEAGRDGPGWRDLIRYGGRLQLEADAFSVGHGTVRLRENRMGQYYANGLQAQGDLWAWGDLADLVTLSADPKFISNPNALGVGATANTENLYFQELNAKFSFANLTFQIGRSNLWWGFGYRSTLLLSDHHFPLDMIQLGSEEVFHLPWVFRYLGGWKINTFLSRLNSFTDQTGAVDQAKLFGARISWLPVRWLELGATRLTQYGLPGQSFPQTIYDAYTLPANQPFGPKKVHEQAMVDFRATIPPVPYLFFLFPSGLQLYGEIGSRDKWSQFPLPSRAAVMGGLYLPQVLRGDTLDLRFEYTNTDLARERHSELSNLWYNDGTYVSGDRLRGFPLGSWVGTDGVDYFVRSSRYLTEALQLGVNLDLWQRGMGQPVHEHGKSIGTDVTWWVTPFIQGTLTYTYQRIENPGQITNLNPFVENFANEVTSINHFLWMNVAISF